MKKSIIVTAYSILLLCSSILNAQNPDSCCQLMESPESLQMFNGSCSTDPHGEWEVYRNMNTYIPTMNPLAPFSNSPIKTIEININIIQKDDGSGNFENNQNTIDRLTNIIGYINSFFSNYSPSDPINWVQELPNYDSRIRFSLGESGNERIYFYKNSASWGNFHPSTLIEPYIAEHHPERLEQLNLYIFGNPNNYNWAHANFPSWVNFNHNSWAVMFYWGSQVEDWAKSTLLAHEFGHNFELLHTYLGGGASAICDQSNENFLQDVFLVDLPSTSNCPHTGGWNNDPYLVNGDRITNNLLGGTSDQRYISPQQAGQMHRSLAITSMRKYVSCEKSDTPIVIFDNKLWDFDIKLYRDLIIDQGAHLTISCNLVMHPDAKIIIKPGGLLTIDGGRISNDIYEKKPWQGIEVWGNKLHSQSPDQNGVVYQGTLELKNGAIIENAITAVALWNPGDYNSTGGIVIANDAIFRNNTRSVHALMYSNFNQYFPELLLPNRSYFKNCTFELTEDYHGDETFYKHVDLFDVFGVDFKACNFSLDPNAPNIGTFNHGIAAYSAGFNLLTVCSNTSVIPCPSYVGNTFNGFNRAVSSSSALLSSPSFFVTGADFSNNAYGIHVNDVGNFTVINSNFNVGIENYNGGCKIGPGVGIYTNLSTGFAIQENNFTKFTSAPPGTYYGTWINNTHQADEVYKNNFTGLKYANYSEGKNWWDTDRFTGLAYYCNENQNNYADFYVGRDASNEGGIQSKQGDLSHDAGNTFTQSGATWHFYNDGNHLIEYYHNNGQANKIPDINLLYQVMPYGINYNNSCPSYYGGGASDNPMAMSAAEQQQAEQLFIANLNDYNNVKTLYSSLIDGGNTGGTLFDIQTAHPDDMWALRAQLLGKSPHLSIGVLKEASDRTDVFNDAALFDILAANPDELKKAELINYLEQKAEPLPDYMVNILKQVAEGTTYKTVLEQQMAHYNRNKTRAAHNMIRHIAHDSIVDNNLLRQWLNNLGGIQSDKQIIGTFVQEGNYANALTLANMLPQLYNLQNDELIAHNDYLEMLNLQHTLHQQNRNLFQLSGAEKQQLDVLATGVGTAALQARAILEMVYHEYTEPCPCMDQTGSLKNADINLSNPAKESLLSVTAKPNPASDWVVFEYSLPGETREATIRISDAGGRIVETMSVSGKQGQKMWDTRGLVSGTYYYVLINAGEYKSGRIVLHK